MFGLGFLLGVLVGFPLSEGEEEEEDDDES